MDHNTGGTNWGTDLDGLTGVTYYLMEQIVLRQMLEQSVTRLHRWWF